MLQCYRLYDPLRGLQLDTEQIGKEYNDNMLCTYFKACITILALILIGSSLIQYTASYIR